MPSTQTNAAHLGLSFSFDQPELTDLIEALGSPSFAVQLLQFFEHLVGADHCALYELRDYKLNQVAAAGPSALFAPQNDLSIYEVKRHLSQVPVSGARVDVSTVGGHSVEGADAIQRRHQRIVISGRRGKTSFCIRVCRTGERELLSDGDLQALRQLADLLLSLAIKHADLFGAKPNLKPALSSLAEIEECVLTSTSLSRWEGEVCSRILYGLSSFGIALDLGIGKESVMTYRKRAYQRLGIGSQRELLMWYLTNWGARGDAVGAEPAKVQALN